MKVTAIINPHAGGSYAAEIYQSVLEQFREYDIVSHLTKGPGDATQLAREAVQKGSDYILCIGGDGTLNEVVQSLAHSSTILVPISAGTGSDFVKTLGFKDLDSVKAAMKEGNYREIDLGLAVRNQEKRFFLNILEIGFGASVMKRVNSRKKTRGGFSFTSSVLALLPFFRPFNVEIEVNGEDHKLELAEMVVANGRYFGGGMLAAPDAELDDGLFDIHVVAGVGKMQMISKLGKLRNGTYVRDPTVRSFKSNNLDVRGAAPVELDGEDFGELPLKITLVERCLRVISPDMQN